MLPDLPINNLTSDWNDGRALCGIVENLRPGLCPDYLDLDTNDKLENVERGMNLAETHLSVPSLIEPHDFIDPNIDELSMMTYLSYFVSPAKEHLLKWVKQIIPEFDIQNFSTDWSDGIALATLMHRLFDQLCPNCADMKTENGLENLRVAIEEGEYRLGLKKLLTPTEMTNPKVDELSVITFLMQLKTATLLPLPGECTCSGSGLEKAVVGVKSRFKVNASRAGNTEQLLIQLKGPGSEDVPVDLSPLSPGVFTVSYCCQRVGHHSLTVTLNGQGVPGSPFKVNAFDPTKCKIITQPTYFIQGDEDKVVIDRSNAGDGIFQAELSEEDKGVVTAETNDSTTTLRISQKTGSHVKLELLFNGHRLAVSPLVVPLVDAKKEASNARLSGSGVYNATNLEKSTFTVTGLPPGLLNADALSISITSIGCEAEVELFENENGTYLVDYVAPKPGAYLIQVKCYDVHIPGSPFKLTVKQRAEASKCIFYPDKKRYKISGEELVFRVDAREAGAGSLAAAVLSEKREVFKVPCEKTGNGQYVLRFTPNDGKCRYILHVRWARKAISGTPHRFRVWPGADASKCIAYGLGLNEGVVKQACEFYIDSREAGIGSLSVRVHGIKDSFKVKVQHGEPDPRVLTASYNPQEAGEYLISIRWSTVEIPGSPFGVYISDPEAELEAQLNEERARQRQEMRQSRRIKSEEERKARIENEKRKKIEELRVRSEEKRRIRQEHEERRQAAILEMEKLASTATRTSGHYSRDALQQYYLSSKSHHAMLVAPGGHQTQYYQHKPITTRHRSSSFRVKREAKKKKKKKKGRKASGDGRVEDEEMLRQADIESPNTPTATQVRTETQARAPTQASAATHNWSSSPAMSDTKPTASPEERQKAGLFGMSFAGMNALTGRRPDISSSTEML